MAKLNFQQPLLQSSVSYHPSEIILICWFDAQETFLTIINVEKVVLLNIFCGNLDKQSFKSNSKDMCNVINVFFQMIAVLCNLLFINPESCSESCFQCNNLMIIIRRTIINHWAPNSLLIHNNWAPNKHIRMITVKTGVMAAKNLVCHHRNLLNYFKLNNTIPQYCCFYCIFDQIQPFGPVVYIFYFSQIWGAEDSHIVCVPLAHLSQAHGGRFGQHWWSVLPVWVS